jgi:hypothetical protein
MTRLRFASALCGFAVVAALWSCGGGEDGGTTDGGSVEDDPGGGPAEGGPGDVIPPASRIVFVSSMKYRGALGGLAGADATCQALAVAGGLPGEFKAWLSDSAASAGERLSHSPDPYVRTDGVQVAADWSELVSAPLSNPINVDEHGGTLPPDGNFFSTSYVWTGTLPDGRGVGPWNCDEWTSAGGREFKDNAVVGKANDPSQWTTVWTTPEEAATLGCEYEFRLYCLEQ